MPDCIAPDYLPVAYNGVFFECIVAQSEHGRRGVTGEFPFGEQTAFQDLGIKIRKYSITGRFQGPECVSQTSALIAAVETPGPGNLIHPTRGALQVSCTSLKVKDDLIQGAGETNFDMEFVDAGSFSVGLGALPIIPVIADIVAAATSNFTANYTPEKALFFQQAAIQQTAQDALAAMAAAFYKVIPGNATQNVYQALYQIQSSATNPDTFIAAPVMINAITFAFAAIDTYAKSSTVEYSTLKDLSNNFAQTATVDDVAGSCQEAIFSTLRSLCAAYMLRSATQTVSPTLEDALAELDAIQTIIEEEKKNALADSNDDFYIALSAFEGVALQALTNYAYHLPPVISYNFKGGIPSLVAAHEIYGDCKQAQALEQRNPLNWPFALGPIIYAVGKTP